MTRPTDDERRREADDWERERDLNAQADQESWDREQDRERDIAYWWDDEA